MSFISEVLKKKKKMGKWENSIFCGEFFFLYIYFYTIKMCCFQLDLWTSHIQVFTYRAQTTGKTVHRTCALKANQLHSGWFSFVYLLFFFYKGNILFMKVSFGPFLIITYQLRPCKSNYFFILFFEPFLTCIKLNIFLE